MVYNNCGEIYLVEVTKSNYGMQTNFGKSIIHLLRAPQATYRTPHAFLYAWESARNPCGPVGLLLGAT
ncbi:hypothetical protein RUM43_012421 [Polyplax serrata]|uniref:Uncharacterized protein n=1 Tax=Polyplax serrata TaxID=468196 RepID=A0AAN8S391_POLSC